MAFLEYDPAQAAAAVAYAGVLAWLREGFGG